ncbi:hypothetical protein ASE63_10905 [Bosea sp. Root381]|nr:hypothetical protein ASE63_10905 [Bosea sp. Root381]
MPRRRTIHAVGIDCRRWHIDLDAVLSSSGGDRSHVFSRLAEQLNLVDDAAVAFVKLQVQPDAWRHSSRAHGPCRRALVVFPFDPALNQVLKDLGPDQVKFDGASKAWSVVVYTDAAVERLIRRLLKAFDALLIDDLGRTAVVYH